MSKCPCSSGKEYKECCQPVINGSIAAETAAQLMRARYTAHVKAEIDFIVATVHPEIRDQHDAKAIKDWAKDTDWQGLEIIKTEKGSADDEVGLVEFIAKYKEDGEIQEHHELSTLKKEDNQWFFVDGRPVAKQVINDMRDVGRNDPCPCGSGKKYKKCCLK